MGDQPEAEGLIAVTAEVLLPMPRVSVLMPVLNAAEYLATAVESVLAQSFGDFEFLIVDDGSTDDSPNILRTFAERDPRIRLLFRPHAGCTAALNASLPLARGAYCARMDADDISLPRRLERQVAFLDADPGCVAVGSRVELIDPDGQALGESRGVESPDHIDLAHIRGFTGVLMHPRS